MLSRLEDYRALRAANARFLGVVSQPVGPLEQEIMSGNRIYLQVRSYRYFDTWCCVADWVQDAEAAGTAMLTQRAVARALPVAAGARADHAALQAAVLRAPGGLQVLGAGADPR